MWLKCYSINIPLFPSGFRAKKDLDVDRRCHLGGDMDQHGNLVVSFRITLHPPLPLLSQGGDALQDDGHDQLPKDFPQ